MAATTSGASASSASASCSWEARVSAARQHVTCPAESACSAFRSDSSSQGGTSSASPPFWLTNAARIASGVPPRARASRSSRRCSRRLCSGDACPAYWRSSASSSRSLSAANSSGCASSARRVSRIVGWLSQASRMGASALAAAWRASPSEPGAGVAVGGGVGVGSVDAWGVAVGRGRLRRRSSHDIAASPMSHSENGWVGCAGTSVARSVKWRREAKKATLRHQRTLFGERHAVPHSGTLSHGFISPVRQA